MVKRTAMTAALALAGLVLTVGLPAAPAAARVVVGVGIGVPFYGYGPWWGYPYPYYYPPPVVYAPAYAPPPVVYSPAPAQGYAQQPVQNWYYCDNPQGYYPTVQSCSTGWRQVPAQPPH